MSALSSTYLVVRTPAFSGRVPVRAALVSGVLSALLVSAFAWSIATGDFSVPIPQVLAVLAGGGDPADRFVVQELRLPRAVLGATVGASLALSGALIQALARNPLASPDVLGVTDGASVGALAVIVLGSSGGTLATGVSAVGVTTAALAGGLVTAATQYLLAWRRGLDGTRLVLVGVGVQAVLTSAVSWMLTKATVWDLPAALVWLSGSLAGRGWHEATPALCALAVLAPAALALAPTLRILQLGDETARGLGVRLPMAQGATLVVAVALAAFAVSAAGPIDFVAFVVPQIALRLVGGGRPPLVACALLGALLVLVADTVSRAWLPHELPVGVVTAILGAPSLLWLLYRSARKVTA